MRVLLAASAIAVCSCSPSIKGQFLSSEQFVKVYEENGQLLADLYRPEFQEDQKPDTTVSLKKDGDVYHADLGLTMSATQTELTVVLGGHKRTLKRIDTEDANHALDADQAVSALRSALLQTTKFEDKYSPCGELDSRKRATIKQALEGATLEASNVERRKPGVAWDRYEVHATLKLPALSLTLPDQYVCTKQDDSRFGTRCGAWAQQDFKVSTTAITLPIVAHIDQSKYPEADPREPEIVLTKLGEADLSKSLFGKQRQLEELLCQQLLVGAQEMAFNEQSASAIRPSQADPTARNDAW